MHDMHILMPLLRCIAKARSEFFADFAAISIDLKRTYVEVPRELVDFPANLVVKADAAPGTAEPLGKQTQRSQLIAHGARFELDGFPTAFQNPVCECCEFAHAGLCAVRFVAQEKSGFGQAGLG